MGLYSFLLSACSFVACAFVAVPSFAWDPNEGAYQNEAPVYRNDYRLRSRSVSYAPPQVMQPPISAYSTPAFASTPVATANTPAPIAPAPAPLPPVATATPLSASTIAAPPPVAESAAVAYVPTPPAYAPAPVAAGTIAAPPPVNYSAASIPGSATQAYPPAPVAMAATPATSYAQVQAPTARNTAAFNGWKSRLGIEYFRDNYKEDVVELDNTGDFGAVTGRFAYYQNDGFAALDLRASYGKEDYSSISGTIDDIPEWEFDNRLLFGVREPRDARQAFTYYFGLGNRYFRDELKGKNTNTGARGYDRRIFQLYVPLGIEYAYLMDSGWSFKPGFEFDYMFYGNVSSRLRGTGLGLENVENQQKSGVGFRGEMMFASEAAPGGVGFEFGPFVRYWWADDSETEQDNLGNTWLEPENSRLQVGATARMLF